MRLIRRMSIFAARSTGPATGVPTIGAFTVNSAPATGVPTIGAYK